MAFQNTANLNEIVIAYAGTDPSDITGDWLANAGLATGAGSDQLVQASGYYLAVKAANPDATITLTGHSLGGGLAALVGVFFDVEAHTFDQAPFARSAQDSALFPSSVAQDLRDDLAAQVDQNGNPVYSPEDLAALDQYLALRDANGGIPNASRVTNIRVDGEFVQGFPLDQFSTIGSTRVIPHGPYSDPSIDMHSAALLTAFLQSEATSPEQRLNQVSTIHTDLLPMLFDNDLYASDSKTRTPNFLDRLVRHEAGGTLPSDGAMIQDTDMVTRFNADLWTLAPAGGMTLSDGDPADAGQNNVNQSLIAFAMQKYYEEPTTGTDPLSPLFTALTGAAGSNGVRFDMADVSPQFAQAVAAGQKLDLQQAKGYALYFQQYLTQGDGLDPATEFFTDAERSYIVSFLPHMRDWYVQAGADGMTATDTLNRGAFMLGGTGLDTYDWHTGDGNDRIIDADRQGVIVIHDGMKDLFGAGAFIRQGTSEVWETLAADGSALTFTHNSSWKLRMAGGAEITLDDNWQEGDFGIRRVEIPTQPPATDFTLQGDLKPLDTNPVAAGVQEGYDTLDNLKVGDEADPDREDTLYDSTGNDLIQGHGGDDTLNAWRGGADLLEGGAGSDVIKGEGDLLYADTQAPIAATLVQGETQPGTGERGDWLSAGADADTLIGAAGNDLLLGGEGEDLLIGGADRFGGDAGEAANDAGWRLWA